jgi:hypothetical protein
LPSRIPLGKLKVNPLLSTVGGPAQEMRLGLTGRHGFADLELPFPQARLDLKKGEFDAFAVHLWSSESRRNHRRQRRGTGLFKKEQVLPSAQLAGLVLRNDPHG